MTLASKMLEVSKQFPVGSLFVTANQDIIEVIDHEDAEFTIDNPNLKIVESCGAVVTHVMWPEEIWVCVRQSDGATTSYDPDYLTLFYDWAMADE